MYLISPFLICIFLNNLNYYVVKATEHLEAFIADCDRRTTAAKQRLAETQEELSAEVTEKANAVHELAEQIGQKLARAEALGEEGMVEESVKLMGEVWFGVVRNNVTYISIGYFQATRIQSALTYFCVILKFSRKFDHV